MRQLEEIVRGDGGVATLPRRGGGAAVSVLRPPARVTVIESKLRPPALPRRWVPRPRLVARSRRAQRPAADGDDRAGGIRQDHAPHGVDRDHRNRATSPGCPSTRAIRTPPGSGAISSRPYAGRTATRETMRAPVNPPPAEVAAALLNALTRLDRDMVIVLDDHHRCRRRRSASSWPRSCTGSRRACASWSPPVARRLSRSRCCAPAGSSRSSASTRCASTSRGRSDWPADARRARRRGRRARHRRVAGVPWCCRSSPGARATSATTSPTRCWPARIRRSSACSS